MAKYVPGSSAGFWCRYGGGMRLADGMCDRLSLLPSAQNANMSTLQGVNLKYGPNMKLTMYSPAIYIY